MNGRVLQILGLVLGAGALLLQISISIPSFMDQGLSLPAALVRFFSYFTILTNIAAVLVYIALLLGSVRGPLAFFARPGVRAAVAVYITIVFLTYATVLAGTWKPQGLFLVCDVLLHYVAPVVYVTWWFMGGRDGSTRFQDMLYWAAFPLIYLAYVLVRAPIAGEVPYPFLDAASKGAGSVGIASLVILLLFIAGATIAVLLDRQRSKTR